MEKSFDAFLVLLALIFSSVAIGLSSLQLEASQIWIVLSFLAFALSLHIFIISEERISRKLATNEGWQLIIIGTILAIVDVGVPYLLLKDVARFWANYLFWSGLTLFVLIVGIWKISRWHLE